MSALETVAPAALTPETPARLIACDRLRAKLPARTCLGLQALGTTDCAGCPVGCAVRLALGVPKPDALAAKEALLAEQAKREAAARAKAARRAAKVAAPRRAPRAACSTQGCPDFASPAPAKHADAIGKCKGCRYLANERRYEDRHEPRTTRASRRDRPVARVDA